MRKKIFDQNNIGCLGVVVIFALFIFFVFFVMILHGFIFGNTENIEDSKGSFSILFLIMIIISWILYIKIVPYLSHNLWDATLANNITLVEKALNEGQDPNSIVDGLGENCLHHSIQLQEYGLVALFTDHDADVNLYTSELQSPLHLISKGFESSSAGGDYKLNNEVSPSEIKIAELLIKKGAMIDALSPIYYREYRLIASSEFPDYEQILLSENATPLFYAAFFGRREIVEILINNGAQINFQDNEDLTCLDFSLMNECPNIETSLEIADLLRKHGGKTGEELKAEGK